MQIDVKDFHANDTIEGVYLVKSALLRPTKKGTQFWSMEIRDKTAFIKAVCWNPNPEHQPAVGDSIRVSAVVEEYNGALQLVIAKISLVPKEEAPSESFLPTSARPAEEMHQELLEKVARDITHPQVKAALLAMLTDPGAKPALLRAPAASRFHHATIGGLLEHILSLWNLSINTWVVYSFLQRDVLLAGCVLHDLAKIAEYTTQDSIDYTPMGRLVGHVIYGSRWAWTTLVKCKVPQDLVMQILHVIASHHGDEFAEIKPQTAEAVAFHYLDELDSRMGGITAELAFQKPSLDGFLYVPILKRKIYVPQCD